MGDSEDFLSEDFEWKDEPGPPRGNGSRAPESGRQPRSLDADLGRLGEATARRGRLALLALAIAAAAGIIAAIALSGGDGKKATATTPTTSPQTTPVQTEPEAPATTPPPAITVSPTTTLRKGDNGPAVRTLQRALVRLDLLAGNPDGDFGAKTEAAVIAFQRAHGLTADGVVGAKTARAINSAVAQAG